MNETKQNSITPVVIGILFIAVGLTVFGIRLIHAGPYVTPTGGALVGALGAIAIGGFLTWYGRLGIPFWIGLVVGTVATLPALYSIMGESEEVISLIAINTDGEQVDLRLWIVDQGDSAWVGMGRGKAIENQLDGAQLQMLRAGSYTCVIPVLHEDRPTVRSIHAMKVQKYTAAQIAGAIGLYPMEAGESTVALRLDPCPNP